MMKRFMCGALAAALVVGSVAAAPATASAKKVKVPKATYTFNMNKKSSKVVAVTRKGDVNGVAGEAAKKKAKGGVMPTVNKKKKVQYKKGHKGKALYLDRTYGVQLKGVKLSGSKAWTVSFWIKIPSGLGNFTGVFFATSDMTDASAKWLSVTKRTDLTENGGSPIIWSRDAKANQWPWYCKNGVDKKTKKAVWTYGTALDGKKWVHIVVAANPKKKVEYGEKGKADYVKGPQVFTYVNGKAYGNGTYAKGAINSKTKYFLGINGWDTPAKAFYDDVQIWSGKALTAKQAKQLYKNQK